MNKKLMVILITIITLVLTSGFVFANQRKSIANTKDPIQKINKKTKNVKAVVKIPILMYHNITDEIEGDYVISIKDFTEQMTYLKENKYRTLSLEEYDRLTDGNKPINEKVVLLTFDDARSSVYDYAYPILKKFNYNATLFVPTGLLNTPTFMTSQQIKLLSKNGFDIAGHTVNHEWLTDFSYKQQMEIIKESNDR
jgi:peptidoglycan/xylan/chitin deacetylase (PgdA/CDA1 family)